MRYTTDEIAELWSDEWMLDVWAAVEIEALLAMHRCGQIPHQWYINAAEAPVPSVQQWRDETALNGHEVVAFLSLWSEHGAEHTHIGLTSSDITDTTLGIRVRQATSHIADDLFAVRDTVAALEDEIGLSVRLGRTHGQPAVATTYGHLLDRWDALLKRAASRLMYTGNQASLGKASGPVGTYLHVDPFVERHVCEAFDLAPAQGASQIVQRDALAAWVAELGLVATTVDAIAMELRLLAHGDIAEVTDDDGSSSSAMPHKTNPNRLERLTGLARVVRSGYDPIAEGVVQWHERDMAHSSVERTLLPQTVGATHYMVRQINELLGSVRFNIGMSETSVFLREEETQSHSIQTHLQLKGYGYMRARGETSRLIRENVTPAQMRFALRDHPDLHDYKKPTIISEGALDGIL